MKKLISSLFNNEGGSVLLGAVVAMVAITAIGLVATRSASIESQIAGQDRFYKMTWFATDGVVSQYMPELVEVAVSLRGFGDEGDTGIQYYDEASTDLMIKNGQFYRQHEDPDVCENNVPSRDNYDAMLGNRVLGDADVVVKIFRGDTQFGAGNSLALTEEYLGVRGRGVSGGGAQIPYIIRGRGYGRQNTQTQITAFWLHVI